MKKKYITPELRVNETVDVIKASGGFIEPQDDFAEDIF